MVAIMIVVLVAALIIFKAASKIIKPENTNQMVKKKIQDVSTRFTPLRV